MGEEIASVPQEAVHIGLHAGPAHSNSGGLRAALAQKRTDGPVGAALFAYLTVHFIAAAKQGQWLEIRPNVVRVGSTLCFATAEIYSGGTLCARANAIFRTV